MTDQAIFFGMFTTFILAHYEPASPLRWHMQDSVKMGLGNAWTTKYCMFATCLLVHSVDLFSVLQLPKVSPSSPSFTWGCSGEKVLVLMRGASLISIGVAIKRVISKMWMKIGCVTQCSLRLVNILRPRFDITCAH